LPQASTLKLSSSEPAKPAGLVRQATSPGSSRPPLKIIVVGDAFTGKVSIAMNISTPELPLFQTTFIKKYCKGDVTKGVEYKPTVAIC
jgi:hypothetical protein